MITIKVTYDDHDYTYTHFNGTLSEAKEHYQGNTFTYWDGLSEQEKKHKAIKVQQIEE